MMNSFHTTIIDDCIIKLAITRGEESFEICLAPRVAVELVSRLTQGQTIELPAKRIEGDEACYALQYSTVPEDGKAAALHITGDADVMITNQPALYQLANRLVRMANDADKLNRYAVLNDAIAVASLATGSLEIIGAPNSRPEGGDNQYARLGTDDLASIYVLSAWLQAKALN